MLHHIQYAAVIGVLTAIYEVNIAAYFIYERFELFNFWIVYFRLENPAIVLIIHGGYGVKGFFFILA